MERARRIVVVGHVTLDHVDGELRPGGSALYAAGVYRDLGAQVRLETAHRPQDDAHFHAALLGVDTIRVASAETTHFANDYTPEGRRVQRVPCVADVLRVEAEEASDVLHLAAVMQEIRLPEALTTANAQRVGVGLQGWLRRAGEPQDGSPVLSAELDASVFDAHEDVVVFVSDEDLLGQPSLLADLRQRLRLLYLTRGADGVRVYRRGESPLDVPAVQGTRPLDVTGAGDVFAAGALDALAHGMDPLAAAARGVALAAVAIQHAGVPEAGAYADLAI